jgi:Cu2+-containing amine oxidase
MASRDAGLNGLIGERECKERDLTAAALCKTYRINTFIFIRQSKAKGWKYICPVCTLVSCVQVETCRIRGPVILLVDIPIIPLPHLALFVEFRKVNDAVDLRKSMAACQQHPSLSGSGTIGFRVKR